MDSTSCGFFEIRYQTFDQRIPSPKKSTLLLITPLPVQGSREARAGRPTCCLQHKYRDAEVVFRLTPVLPDISGTLACSGIAGRGSKKDDARRVLRRLRKLSEATYIPARSVAMKHIGRDQVGHTPTWLTHACEETYGTLAWLSVDPIFDTLRMISVSTDSSSA